MAATTVSNEPTVFQSCCAACCCLEIRPRDDVADWMLRSDNADAAPSFMQRCLCQCGPEKRVLSGVEDVPQISSLAGATLQYGTHATGGSVQTLKWCKFDKDKRVADLQVFGGFGGTSSVGLWTEPAEKCYWTCLINLGRVCNYSYRFEFAEDWRHVDIKIRANICCCIWPWAPAWFQAPDNCATFSATQTDESTDGKHWVRKSSTCGGEEVYSYDLYEVFTPSGQPGAYHDKLFDGVAPLQMLISR